jgi:hypothetical protein
MVARQLTKNHYQFLVEKVRERSRGHEEEVWIGKHRKQVWEVRLGTL